MAPVPPPTKDDAPASAPVQRTSLAEERRRARVRTHLANERTFLAWTRTGLTLIALGLGAAQVLDQHDAAGVSLVRVLAALLVALGGGLTVLGRWRFRSAAIAIEHGNYRTHRRVLDVVVVGVLAICAVALLLVWRLAN